ncbi:hypothetical protein FSW04_19245 [Baekduia soli]|uniref:Rhomboid family intramembrane serine protease n=1 Tax=Baekduia soli TaxID=496014 RepID=A0A5B8UA57_9ACTN|nr:hypothetical protein [Baekduia soli]QEC49491.1 hypothetical protein FSW04_19245 [Baekduia soli]
MARARSMGPGAAAAVAWLAAVATLALTRAAWGVPRPATLAASPDALQHGRLWLLATSALIVDGPPVLQIAGTAVLVWVIIARFGARLFWVVAAAGHVISTLAVYSGIGVLGLVDAHAVRNVADTEDYGISAIWAACLGALLVAALRGRLPRGRPVIVLGVACLLTFVVLVPAQGELSDFEHLVAFTAGAACAAAALHHAGSAPRGPLRPSRLPSLRRRPRAAARAAR